ncbi:hypothetical protein OG21DRAFT_1505135 [Imleria badia]|nr:hypothetical protein OG21DRAFT_1505135 [Imleria badia]
MDVHSPASSTPLMNTTTITTSQIPSPPPVPTDTATREPSEPFPSLAALDAMMRDLQPSPSATAAVDSLVSRQERLHSISAKLANLASPLPPPSSHSPPPDSSSVTRASANITPNQPSESQRSSPSIVLRYPYSADQSSDWSNITPIQPSESQHSSNPIILRQPYSANQSSDQVGSSINDTQMNTNDSSLALVPSPTTLTQEHQTQGRAIIVAVQNLNSALKAAHRAQVDNENALTLRIRTFEEQRAAFEQTKQAEEARLQQEFQALQQKREELNAKEGLLALLDKENKAREDARKNMLARRQVQEEEKRAAEAKRVQEVQDQITTALNELKEIETLKAKCQVEQQASETLPNDLPTEPKESMNEEETAAIKSRNDLLLAVKHLRRMHAERVQKVEETNRTLLRLGEERKKREAEEAERRRVAEEERQRALAEMERSRQLQDEKQRQFEAERKRREVENDREQAQLLVEQQAHAEAQAHVMGRIEATNGQRFEHLSHTEELSASQQQGIADTSRIRQTREDNSLSPETTNAMNVDEDRRAFAPHRAVPSSDIHTSPGASQKKQKKAKAISGGVMLAASTPKASGAHLPPKPATPPSFSSSDRVAENTPNAAGTSPTIRVSAEGGHGASFPAQLASGFNRAANADIRPTPDYKSTFSRTPKSQTILEASAGNQELNINLGPVTGVSPAQQTVNLRHLKRFRGLVEGNDSGDRSVRTVQVKSEENSHLSPKREEHDDQSRELAQASLLINPLTPRTAVISPPRPRMVRKRQEAPATSQPDPSSSYPPQSNEPASTRKETEVTIDEQPREVLLRDAPSFQAMDAPVQQLGPAEVRNSLLLGPVYTEPQALESRIHAGERLAQDRGENSPSEPASASLSHELDGEDPSRSNRRFTDEHRRARNANGSRRVSDHYSPPSGAWSTVTSPTEPHRITDSWHPPNSSNGPRAEPMRTSPPITGKKRPSEFNDNEHGHRARRQRGDVWKAQDHGRDRVDSYRPHWDRHVDTEPDERRAAYRAPPSPVDRIRPYPSDVPRATCDNRTYTSEEPTSPVVRWEPSYRRTETDELYLRYPPSLPAYSTMADQHYTDDARVGPTYEPMTQERMDAQPDPPLLARMHDTQRLPPRGRGRGEPSRGRGDFGRGRGRGAARGGTPLIDRLTTGPSSLEERLT